jgi:hypothetical protein
VVAPDLIVNAAFCPKADERALTRRFCTFSYVIEMTAEIRIARNVGMWWRWPSTSHVARPAIV